MSENFSSPLELEIPKEDPQSAADRKDIAKFISAPPFVPSFLRGGASEERENISIETEKEVDIHQKNSEDKFHSLLHKDNTELEEPQSSLLDFSTINGQQFALLMELIPSEIQELLQVNLSHLQNTPGASSNESIDSLRLKAANLTFNQLSFQQLSSVNEAWTLVFGSDDGEVNEDPESMFAYRDDGLLPDEVEWFFSQMMNEGSSQSRCNTQQGRAGTPRRKKGKR